MASIPQSVKDYIDLNFSEISARDIQQDIEIENLKIKVSNTQAMITSSSTSGDYATKPPSALKIKNKAGRVIAEIANNPDNSTGESLILNGDSGTIELPASGLTVMDKPYINERPMEPYAPYVPRTYPNFDPLATAVIDSLGHGLNFGQTWDATDHTAFMDGRYRNCVVTQKHLQKAWDSGFKHVRLPVRISGHTTTTVPYTVDQNYLDNYFAVVEQALAIGFKVIVDNHDHTSYLNRNSGNGRRGGSLPRSEQLARQQELTVQFAQRASQYSWQDVLIELENEPNNKFNADWNDYWPNMLAAVRAAVPNHILILGGKDFNGWEYLKDLASITDDRVALVTHFYEPFLFTHNDKNPPVVKSIGDGGISLVETLISNVDGEINTLGRPVLITEAGVANVTTKNHMKYYLRKVSNEFNKIGCQVSFWNAYGDFAIMSNSGQFIHDSTLAITGQEPSPSVNPDIVSGENMIDLASCVFVSTNSLWSGVKNEGAASRDTTMPDVTTTEDTFTLSNDLTVANYTKKFLMIPYIQLRGQDWELKNGDTIRITCGRRFRLACTSYFALEVDYEWLPLPNGSGQTYNAGTHDIVINDRNARFDLREMVPLGLTIVMENVNGNVPYTLKIEKL